VKALGEKGDSFAVPLKKAAKRKCSAIGRWVSTQPHCSFPRLIGWRGAKTSLSFFV